MNPTINAVNVKRREVKERSGVEPGTEGGRGTCATRS